MKTHSITKGHWYFVSAVFAALVATMICLLTMTHAKADEDNRVKVTCSMHTTARLDYLRPSDHRHHFAGGGKGILTPDTTLRQLQDSQSSCAIGSDTALYWTMAIVDPVEDGTRVERVNSIKAYYALEHMDRLPEIGQKVLGTYEQGNVTFKCGSHGPTLPEPPVGCEARDWRAIIAYPGTNASIAVHYDNSNGKLRSLPRVSGDDGWMHWTNWHGDLWFTPRPAFIDLLERCERQMPDLGPDCRTENQDLR